MASIKTTKIALSAFLAAVVSTGVSAQDHSAEFTVLGGYHYFDEDYDDDKTWGAAIGLPVSDRWTLEFVWSAYDTNTRDNPQLDLDGVQYRLDGVYNIETSSAWKPYLAFGVGDQKREFNKVSERDTLVNLGTGVKRDLGNSWQFRTDLRAFNSLDNEYTDMTINLGLSYLFGKRKAAPVAPAPAPVVEDKDSDGDGVPDSRDKCPNTVSGLKVDADGCPVVLEKTLVINLEILFDTAKAEVKDQYLPQVKKLADALNQYENTVVTVEGHTDNTGSAALNKRLSQQRADAVKTALVTKFGIAADRVNAVGYGLERPVASNATVEGRAQNRRVVGEVSVRYKEEVKR